METGMACCARGAFLPGVSSQHSKALPSISPSFSSRSLKSSSLFGESLRLVPKSSMSVSKAKSSSLVTRCEIGDSLEEFLAKATPDKGLIRVMMCMGEALRTISFKVRTASCGGTACVNSFGDEQLAVDMLADKLLFEALTYSHYCKYACSEEVPELQDMGGPVEGGFSVAFDPLDGSSIVDTNFAVGTIFGVWPGDKLTGVTGRDQVAAAMGVYGPRTTYVLALKDYPGTHEFLLLDEGKWQHVKETTEVGEGKLFSPGNLRATFDNPDYDKLINYYVKEKYTLRYTGGMVPDVNQILVKEKGIFTNVSSPSTKAKLRLLFEVAPLGSLNDDALILIALRCRNLTRLKLRGCREITDLGISEFAKHCSDKLKKLSFGSCVFGAHGMNAVLNHCKNLEEISIKRLRGILEGAEKIGPGAAASSLKSICLKELVNGQCFEPMVMGATNLETLKVIQCLGDWDGVVGAVGRENNGCLIEVHLEKIRVSDLGLLGISKCVNLETLHIVKAPECSNSGLVTVAQNCRKLRKLHVDGWGTHRIGDEGLIAVANNCGNLQELVLIGVHATHFSLSAIGANCLRLERLALCGSGHIGDAEIACVAYKCVALKKLCIKGCSISDTAIEALSWGCPNLVKIKVKKCRGVSNEVFDWLQQRKGGLVVNFDACETEGLDASSSDIGGQETGVEFPGMGGGQLVVAGAPSGGAAGRARLALAWAKLGVFAGRNLVTCAFNRWSINEG